MATLLEQAKEIKCRKYTERVITYEDIDLIVAYLKEEIEIPQIKKVKGFKPNDNAVFCTYMLKGIRKAIKEGLISIKRLEV